MTTTAESTPLLRGWIRLLTVAPELNSPDLALVCVVGGPVDFQPTVKIERIVDGAVDSDNGRMSVSEVGAEETTLLTESTNGVAEFTLASAGEFRRAIRLWELLIRSPAGGLGTLTFRVSAGVKGTSVASLAMQHLAESDSLTISADMLNATGTPKIKMKTLPLPRLALGVNNATPDQAPPVYRGHPIGSGSADTLHETRKLADLAALLHQIFFQLDAAFSLDSAWDEQAGPDSWLHLTEAARSVSPIAVAEERWARQVTEMLLATVYKTSSVVYGNWEMSPFTLNHLTRESYLKKEKPFYALGYVCQDLATFGVSSRGVVLNSMLQAGAISANLVLTASPKGQWFNGTTEPKADPAAKSGQPQHLMNGPSVMNLSPLLEKVPSFGPGAVHLFSNQLIEYGAIEGDLDYDALDSAFTSGTSTPGKAAKKAKSTLPALAGRDVQKVLVVSNTGERKEYEVLLAQDQKYAADNQPVGAHIGFALRVRPDRKQVQFFDTGALNVEGSPAIQKGNFDTAGTTQIKSRTGLPYKGTGVFPPLDPDAAKSLCDTVSQLAKARPLGLARLAILARGKYDEKKVTAKTRSEVLKPDGALVYASPLLRMWDDEDTQNYHLSRLVWSIRQLPNAQNLNAVWLVYVPKMVRIDGMTHDYATALANADRNKGAIEVAQELLGADITDFPRNLASLVEPIRTFRVADGAGSTVEPVTTTQASHHFLYDLDGTMSSSEILLPLDKPFPADYLSDSVPSYFNGKLPE